MEPRAGRASWPSPWPRGSAGPCQEGGDQDQLLGHCLGWGHLSPVCRGRDGQAFVTWLGAISLSAPGLKIKRFISGRLVPTMLSAVASLHSPASQPVPLCDCPFGHGDTNTGTYLGFTADLPTLGRCSRRVRPILLQASDPFLNPASTLLSISLLPSCYLSCHAAPGQVCHCPHGMALSDAAAPLRAWFSQSSPSDGEGRDRLGMLDNERGVQNLPLDFFWGVSRPQNQRLPGWDEGWEAPPSPFGSALPQQLPGRTGVVFQGPATQSGRTQTVLPVLPLLWDGRSAAGKGQP